MEKPEFAVLRAFQALFEGTRYKHPVQEASSAESRLREKALPSFDEFLFLRFRASNVPPYPFEWMDLAQTGKEYGALLLRVSRLYDQRFGPSEPRDV